jgi:hypothetical protein
MYRIILVLITLSFAFGCQKNELKITSDFDCTKQPASDRNGAPSVQIVDSTIVFQSIEHYNQVREYVRGASVATLMAWQQSIGFKSARYYYEEAIGQNCCPDEENNFEQITASYAGKVLYDPTEKDIKPLLPFVTTGWLVNHRGDFKVGNSLVRYTPNHVISIIDGSLTKLSTALSNPVDNAGNGIYVHPTVGDRGDCCAWNLHASSVNNGSSSGSKRIETAWVTNWDESFSFNVPNFGTMYNVIFTFGGYFHHQRRTLIGWVVCQRTRWEYSAGEVARIINIPPNCQCLPAGFVNPKTISISTTSANECKLNFEQDVFAGLNVTPAVYSVLDLCVEEISLNTKALDSNLSTSNQFQ